MYYEINIAKKNLKTGEWEHLFATAKRSITTWNELKRVYAEIARAFDGEGYHITVRQCEETGRVVDVDEIKA